MIIALVFYFLSWKALGQGVDQNLALLTKDIHSKLGVSLAQSKGTLEIQTINAQLKTTGHLKRECQIQLNRPQIIPSSCYMMLNFANRLGVEAHLTQNQLDALCEKAVHSSGFLTSNLHLGALSPRCLTLVTEKMEILAYVRKRRHSP